MREIWKDVKGFEGIYQVSNYGRVKAYTKLIKHSRVGYMRRIKERFLSICDNGYGYKNVYFCVNGKRTVKYIHRLVAEAFLPNPQNYKEINHKDYNKENNFVENLEWCSRRQNIEHSLINMYIPRKKHKPSGTGYKYIYFRKRNGKTLYRLVFYGYEKTFNTLSEALEERGRLVNGKEYYLE